MKKRKANTISVFGKEQYHIACKKGDVAKNIIFVGDPERAFRISTHFNHLRFRQQHREFITFTGTYKHFPITVMSTGIGQGSMEIALIEVCQIVKDPTIIRCGTSSGLQKNIQLGDLVITDDVHDLGNLADYYKLKTKKLKADLKIRRALASACEIFKLPFHIGKTASAPGFYGPQGRQIPGFPIKYTNIISTLARKKVLNMEMEVATLFSLASCKNLRAGAICSAIGNRITNSFMDETGILRAESASIQCVLKAFEILHQRGKS